MLKGIDQRLTADVLHALMQMGHGDMILLCDVNHPAASIAARTPLGRVLDMAGCDIIQATQAILTLMPLDTFVPQPVAYMQMVGDASTPPEVCVRMQQLVDKTEGRSVKMEALERFAFYQAAHQAFCVVRTSDSGPYGCFLMKKGVVDLPPFSG